MSKNAPDAGGVNNTALQAEKITDWFNHGLYVRGAKIRMGAQRRLKSGQPGGAGLRFLHISAILFPHPGRGVTG